MKGERKALLEMRSRYVVCKQRYEKMIDAIDEQIMRLEDAFHRSVGSSQ
jgi:hypothetical protein